MERSLCHLLTDFPVCDACEGSSTEEYSQDRRRVRGWPVTTMPAKPRSPLPLRTDGGLLPHAAVSKHARHHVHALGGPRSMTIAWTRQPLGAPSVAALCHAGAGVDLAHPPSVLQCLTRATRASQEVRRVQAPTG